MCALSVAAAQANDPLLPGVVYVCSGERMFIENCNVRDTSDTSTCMVGHPDHIQPNGLMQYTNATRGALKKLFPTCTQPSTRQVAAAKAFQQKQQDTYNANVQKADTQLKASTQPIPQPGQPAPLKNAEEREMRRCVSSGRLPSSCTGNQLLGAFTQMFTQVTSALAPGEVKKEQPSSGPNMAGVFEGPGHWRLDFIDGGVLVNCSFLSPNQEAYSLDFRGGRAVLTINTRPRPLVLTLHGTETITGPPGPVTIDGVVAGGYTPGTSSPGHTETSQTTTHEAVSQSQAGSYNQSQLTYQGNGQYDAATTHTSSTYVPGASTPGSTNFVPKRATCSAINLSSKGAGTGIQTMQTDLLKSVFGGDKGAPAPPGVRMHGIFAAPTGFSVQFFPESVILGCGPDAARAYPYTVEPGATGVAIKIAAPDHPLALAIKPDGSLDPDASGPYQVHGRVVTGQNDNDDFTFAPLEQTCNLAVLTPSKTIPSSGGGSTMLASAGSPAASPANNSGTLSSSATPLGNATLSIVSGLPPQAGTPNPLAGHPYTLLRNSVADILAQQGVAVPPGSSPYKVLGTACGNRTPDCQKILDAVKANAASAIRADANGSATFPGVPPGTYYLMISARYNNQALVWDHPLQLKPGPNTLSLDQRNATPIN
ncbi:hypothetical protein RBB79_09140 [Tunturiibacter empetritectus]|uniref:Uncharacterized protein n=1 Tax=Tunturiibacter lichenicola TaxID=2051959 RepID=A0A852V9T4_9BACT|nr:hypothetical protein [Edaphobacter lichenicola]NYF89708.1 hypothetical protein [Edaphobacter lichenicola]